MIKLTLVGFLIVDFNFVVVFVDFSCLINENNSVYNIEDVDKHGLF